MAAVAERGYAATRVADVIERSGVSRNTFYQHFDSLYDCFLQTLDAILADAEAAMAVELESDVAWDERLHDCFETLIDLVIAQPAAARLCLVDAYAAGPEAVGRVDRVARSVGRRARAVLEESPERAGMPTAVARAVLGGLRIVIQTRLHTGRERELPGLVPQLMDWALGYRTPPAPLRVPERPPAAPPSPPRRGLDDTRKRIVDALTTSVARQGYARTTITEIAEVGSMSLTTFYKRFDSKETAFLAALDDAMLGLLDVSLPAYADADDWPRGVRAGLERLLAYLSSEPDIAKFAAQAVWTGIPAAFERLGQRMASFQALLAEGLRQPSQPSDVVAEAIGASILALGYDDLARRGAETLYELAPSAAFVALAPAIGTIEACTVVNGR